MAARGTLIVNSSTIDIGTIERERQTVRAGLIHKNVPTASSDNAFQGAFWGRGREIIIDGHFSGTQAQVESFLSDIEGWMNDNESIQVTAQYYPLHHKSNTLAGSNQQDGFYNVGCDEFDFVFVNDEPGRVSYTLVMREGTKLSVFSSLAGGS